MYKQPDGHWHGLKHDYYEAFSRIADAGNKGRWVLVCEVLIVVQKYKSEWVQ